MIPPPPIHKINKFLLQSLSMLLYCVQQEKVLKSKGHVFDLELSFHLLQFPFLLFQYSYPINLTPMH